VFHFFMVLRLHSICWSVDRVWICMGTAEPAKEGQRTSHGHTHILDTAKETTGRNTWRGISLQFGLATAHNMAHMWDDPHCLDWPRDHVSSYQAICYTIRTYVLLLAGTKVQNGIALFSLADWIAFVRISGDNTMHVEITRPARTRVSRESPSLVSIQLFLGYRHVSFYAPQHTYLCAS
jgi:hypothetical protein